MAISIDNIELLIDVVDNFSKTLDRLSARLFEIGALAESVEDITIDVDVRGDESAMAKLNALAANARAVDGGVDPGGDARTSGGRDVDVNLPPNQRIRDLWGMGGMDTPEEAFDMPDLFEGRGRRGGILGRLSRMLGGAEDSEGIFDRFNIRMETFHNLLASLLPMLFVFIGALPAAITALATLAGAAIGAAVALGGIAALGFVGLAHERGGGDIMSGFQNIVEDLRETVMDTLVPVADAFDDLARDALDGIRQLLEEIAARADSLVRLKDEARDLGNFLLDVIPVAVERLAQLTEAFAPVLGAIGEWLASANLLERWVDITERSLPALWGIAAAFGAIIPTVMDFSVVFLQVTEAFLDVVGVVMWLLDLVPYLNEGLALIIGSGLMLITIGSLLAKTYSLLAWLWGFAAVKSIFTFVTGLEALTIAELQAMTATQLLTAALRALLATTGIGLLLIGVSALADEFMGVTGSIQDATSSLKEFGRVSNRVSGAQIGAPEARSGVQTGGQTTVNFTKNTTVEGSSDPQKTSRELRKLRFKDGEFSPY